MEEESFGFDDLPCTMRRTVMEKFDYGQLVIFDQSSRLSHSLTQSHKSARFPMQVEEIIYENKTIKVGNWNNYLDSPIDVPMSAKVRLFARRLVVKDPLTDEVCTSLCHWDIKTWSLICKSVITCSPRSFSQLLERTSADLSLSLRLPDNQTEFPYETGNLEEVEANHAQSLNSNVIFSIKAKNTVIVNDVTISASALVERLMQWRTGSNFCVKDIILQSSRITEHSFLKAIEQQNGIFEYYMSPDLGSHCWFVTRDSPHEPVLHVSVSSSGVVTLQLSQF